MSLQGTLVKDRYLIQELLGEGGMGAVYRAVDTTSRETVAVKILFDRGDDAALLRSLGHEARAVARLHHPNVVRLVDFGRSVHGPFLVMEYAPGQSLKRWNGFLSMRQLAPIFDEILAALGYAHARGVVHRDLKPDNILVVEDARGELHPKLVDFGIAQVTDLETSLGSAGASRSIIGTPTYMSPEQARGQVREVGPASDLYAVGIMLYEFVTGRVPFKFDNIMGTILAQVRDPVPPLEPLPGTVLPPGLEAVVMRLLEKLPRQRYAFAADVRRALRRLEWDLASSEPPAGRLVSATAPHGPPITGGAADDVDALTVDPFPAAFAEPASETDLLKTLLDDRLITAGGPGLDALSADPDVVPLAPGLFGMREVPLVGRVAERHLLWDALETMLAEASVRALVLSGPGGIGKSRLARWLAERAEEEGLAMTLGVGVGASSELPTGGLRTLVDRYLRLGGLDRKAVRDVLHAELIEPGLFQKSELEPLLDYLRPDANRTSFFSDGAIEPVGLVARMLRGATARRPVLLWLDDVAGADARLATDLIDFLVASRAFSPMPVFVVATLSDPVETAEATDVEAWRALWRLSSEEPAVQWHALSPMSRDETEALARSMLPLADDALAMVATQAAGYPRYVARIIDHWLRNDLLTVSPDGTMVLTGISGALPSTVHRLLESHLGDVLLHAPDPAAARAVVELAAVVGRHFEHDLLVHVLELDGRSAQLPALDAVWDALIEHDLWVELDEGKARFASAELHEHVVAALLKPSEAVRLHAIVAQAITELRADTIARHHGELAIHYDAAGRFDEAVEHMVAGAEQARVWGRLAEAGEWYDAARDLVEQRPVANRLEQMDRVDLGQAVVLLQSGEFESVEPLLEAIAARRRAGARQDVLARLALLRAELARARGRIDEAEPLYQAALVELERHAGPEDVVQALRGLAELHVLQVRYADAGRVTERAREVLRSAGSRLLLGRVLLVEGKVAALQHAFDTARTCYERAGEAFAEAGARQGVAEARFAGVHLLIHQARYAEALAELESVLEAFIDVGDRAAIAQTQRAIGQLARLTGDLDRAESALKISLDIARRIGDRLAIARAYNGLGELARQRSDWEAARSHYRAYLEAARGVGDTLSVTIGTANLGLVEVQLEHWTEAAEAFRSAVEQVRQAGNRPFLGAFLGCLAHAEAAAGREDSAAQALDEALVIDAELEIGEKDFLKSLEGFALVSASRARDLERARRALEVARARWAKRGDADAVARVERALAAL